MNTGDRSGVGVELVDEIVGDRGEESRSRSGTRAVSRAAGWNSPFTPRKFP